MSKVRVDVDGTERTLVLDFNALANIEVSIGKRLTDQKVWADLSMKEIRTVLHAALLRDWPEATEDDAGKLDISALTNLSQLVSADPLAATGSKPGQSEGTI